MDRKAAIIEAIRTSETPVSASALARKLHVSRQIIVGDIALIRASGTQIIATPRGYVWERSNAGSERKIAVLHAPQQMREELYTHGVHLHTIRCRDAAVFERVENALRKKGLLYEEAKRSSDQG